jgi:chromosome segregation ATPase
MACGKELAEANELLDKQDADIEEYKAQIAFLEQELASAKDKPDN